MSSKVVPETARRISVVVSLEQYPFLMMLRLTISRTNSLSSISKMALSSDITYLCLHFYFSFKVLLTKIRGKHLPYLILETAFLF